MRVLLVKSLSLALASLVPKPMPRLIASTALRLAVSRCHCGVMRMQLRDPQPSSRFLHAGRLA